MGLAGDGAFICTASANTGTARWGRCDITTHSNTDGKDWKPCNSQTFSDAR
jgi:hypothetical protein